MDDRYREELLANPKSAIQQEFGKELPLGLEVRVVEESANVVYLVLPPKPVGRALGHGSRSGGWRRRSRSYCNETRDTCQWLLSAG
jgi:hypothetical protein